MRSLPAAFLALMVSFQINCNGAPAPTADDPTVADGKGDSWFVTPTLQLGRANGRTDTTTHHGVGSGLPGWFGQQSYSFNAQAGWVVNFESNLLSGSASHPEIVVYNGSSEDTAGTHTENGVIDSLLGSTEGQGDRTVGMAVTFPRTGKFLVHVYADDGDSVATSAWIDCASAVDCGSGLRCDATAAECVK